ncbi:MAG: phosphoglycolate phosphatase [Candidatus Parcubacteria bacterium]|jgi:phosphoglycolate phosphatase|nr:phosphoglycolate phosphatase [Candidatus Parcubacteria bacterium]
MEDSHKKAKIVFFDFDGVIVDTSETFFAIRKLSDPTLTFEKFIGFFTEKTPDNAAGEAAPADSALFNQLYGEHLAKQKISREMIAVIKVLAGKYVLAVVSSSRSDIIRTYLSTQDILSYFSDILGSDVDTSKSAKIDLILDKYRLTPSDSVFVTDTLGDIEQAHHSGVKSIGVTWGFHAKETLEKGQPKMIVSTPKELFDSIEHLLEGKLIGL